MKSGKLLIYITPAKCITVVFLEVWMFAVCKPSHGIDMFKIIPLELGDEKYGWWWSATLFYLYCLTLSTLLLVSSRLSLRLEEGGDSGVVPVTPQCMFLCRWPLSLCFCARDPSVHVSVPGRPWPCPSRSCGTVLWSVLGCAAALGSLTVTALLEMAWVCGLSG